MAARRIIDHETLYGLLPRFRPGITIVQLLAAADLPHTSVTAVRIQMHRWRELGAAHMVLDERGRAGLWIRGEKSYRELTAIIAQRARQQRHVRQQQRAVAPDPPAGEVAYPDACAQLNSLGAMCEALTKGR